ncbi:riboflavin kinase, partial [Planctomycetota bacterium]
TFKTNDPVTVETHILDFDEDIYDVLLELQIVSHVRGEIKFNSVDELIEQIQKDMSTARNFIANNQVLEL